MDSNSQPKSQNSFTKLLTTTFMGGLFVVLPGYLAILVLNKMIKGLIALTVVFLKPIADLLGIAKSDMAIPVALVTFAIICFISGLIIKTSSAQLFKKILEPLFAKIPGYLLMRRVIRRIHRMEQSEQDFELAFVAVGDINEALSPSFLIERHDNGFYTAFVPTVPTPTAGSIYLVPEDKVFIVDVPLLDMVKYITRWGDASPALLESIKQIQPGNNNTLLASSEDN